MLTINNLTKKYRGSDSFAIKDISFEVGEGEIFGFLGPNGAGKSTTIKCMTGILPYDSGTVTICGHSLKDNPISAKMNMGYVSDDHLMYEKLTAREYINFISNIFNVGANDRKARTDKFLQLFDLGSVFDKQISTYSHGMKQKICVIGALVHNPKLWILDEPMTGLDPKSAFDLKTLMREHCNEGNSVMFSSHMLEVVEKICDKIGIVDKGEMLMVSDMETLKNKADELSLEDFFLKVTGGASAQQA